MTDQPVSDQQLSMLLQVSRDFALEQMARGDRLIPFAAHARQSGEIEFARFASADSDEPLGDIYDKTQKAMAGEAAKGEILAASLVAAVQRDEALEGCDAAICIHVEAPGFCRQILAPYAIDPAPAGEEKAKLRLAEMVAQDTSPVIFA